MPEIYDKIIQEMTPQRRIEVSMMLYHSARHFKVAWLRKIHPDWSEHIQRRFKGLFGFR